MKTLVLFLASTLFLSIMQKDNNSLEKKPFLEIKKTEIQSDDYSNESRLPVIIVKRD